MSFPQVISQTSGTVASNSTSWNINFPASRRAGDLLVFLAAIDGNPTAFFGFEDNQWQKNFGYNGNAVTIMYAYKKISGNETEQSFISLSASEQGAWLMYNIRGWSGYDSGIEHTFNNLSGNSTSVTIPSFNPEQWYVEDTLWLAAGASDAGRSVTSFPSSYENTESFTGGAQSGATLMVGRKQQSTEEVASDQFTISNSDESQSVVVGIRSAPSGWGIPIY